MHIITTPQPTHTQAAAQRSKQCHMDDASFVPECATQPSGAALVSKYKHRRQSLCSKCITNISCIAKRKTHYKRPHTCVFLSHIFTAHFYSAHAHNFYDPQHPFNNIRIGQKRPQVLHVKVIRPAYVRVHARMWQLRQNCSARDNDTTRPNLSAMTSCILCVPCRYVRLYCVSLALGQLVVTSNYRHFGHAIISLLDSSTTKV